MANGLQTQPMGVDPSVDPVILAVMFAAFLIGAIGPFAMCVIGSIRDERRMRRLAAAAGRPADAGPAPAALPNPVDPAVVPAAAPLQATAAPARLDPANDAERAVRAVGR